MKLRRRAKWNPRFVQYARSLGMTPEQHRAANRGKSMSGFIVWMSQRWTEWRALRGVGRDDPISPVQHNDFDAWLADRVDELVAAR